MPGGAHILLSSGAFLLLTNTSPRFDDVWNVVGNVTLSAANVEDARRRADNNAVEYILAVDI